MIRDHAAAVEADLAFRGIDFRDYWLPGGGASRLSMRRLWLMVLALPWESATKHAIREEKKQQQAQQLAGRRDHYKAKKAEQEAASWSTTSAG